MVLPLCPSSLRFSQRLLRRCQPLTTECRSGYSGLPTLLLALYLTCCKLQRRVPSFHWTLLLQTLLSWPLMSRQLA